MRYTLALGCNAAILTHRCIVVVLRHPLILKLYCLVGLVVTASASRAEDPGFDSRLRRDFSGVESYR